jgi:hypothetical protein
MTPSGMIANQAFRFILAVLSVIFFAVSFAMGLVNCPTPGNCTVHESDAQYWAQASFAGLLCYYLYTKWRDEDP